MLEYAVCVFLLYQLEVVSKIESVQRRFTERLSGLSNVSYSDKLTILGIRSFQVRRPHQDFIYTCKIIFGLVDLNCSKFFCVSANEATRGHVSKLLVVKIWNSLPATVEDFAKVRKFKSLLECVNLSRSTGLCTDQQRNSALFVGP